MIASCCNFAGDEEESEEKVVPILEVPEVSLVSVDTYGFSVQWEKMNEISSYEIEWQVNEMNTGQVLAGSSFSVGADDTLYTSDTWIREGGAIVNGIDFCGNTVVFKLKASRRYSSEIVHSEPTIIEFEAPVCEYELEVVGENTFDICALPQDNPWQKIGVRIKNTSYDYYEPFNCTKPCRWENYKITYSLSGTKQEVVNSFYDNFNDERILKLETGCYPPCGDSGTSFYFDQEVFCGKEAGMILLEYFLVEQERDSTINSIDFTFSYN